MPELDKLTGFMTQKEFLERIEHEVVRAKRYKLPLSLIMFEINYDYFEKEYDVKRQLVYTLLRQLGVLFREAFRNVDLMARYKGDVIAVLCPGTDETGAKRVTERVRKDTESKAFKGDEKKDVFHIAVSAGIATYFKHADTSQQLIAAAQKALNIALEKGGNRVEECPITLKESKTTS